MENTVVYRSKVILYCTFKIINCPASGNNVLDTLPAILRSKKHPNDNDFILLKKMNK